MCFWTFLTLDTVLINIVIEPAYRNANVQEIDLFIFTDLFICSLCLKVLHF